MEREVIFAEDVEKIFGKRPWTSRSEEIFGSEEEQKGEQLPEATETAQPEIAENAQPEIQVNVQPEEAHE
jgi:cell division protease FtsH